MKMYYRLFLSVCLSFFGIAGMAQSDSCNAEFGVSISGNTVFCFPLYSGPNNPGYTHLWHFSDGTSSTDINATHTFDTCGTFQITHLIHRFDSIGTDLCSDSSATTITLLCPAPCNLQPGFTWAVAPNQSNTLNIAFTNSTQGYEAGDSVFWSFGDGGYSYDYSPQHSYSLPGTYQVCLLVRKNNNPPGTFPCARELCYSVTVNGPCVITPSFTSNALSPAQANHILFNNTSQPYPYNATVTWTFGDGTSGVGQTVDHLYQQPGTYQVCLHVQQDSTCSADTCRSITIANDSSFCTITAAFGWTQTQAQPGNYTVQFQNNSTGWQAGDSIRWNFGDGTVSSDLNPVHHFNQPGSHFVCLELTHYGSTIPCVSQVCYTVFVSGNLNCQLMPSYTVQIPDPTQPNVLVFTNTSSPADSAMGTNWMFGDGSSGVGNVITHAFPQGGTFNVCMQALSGFCTADTCGPVVVTMPTSCNLSASFGSQQLAGQPTVLFTNNTVGLTPGDTIRWTFGDGSFSSQIHPQHTFATPGTYIVCLRVQHPTAPGLPVCVSEYCDSVVVAAVNTCQLQPSFTAVLANPNQPNVFTLTNTTTGATANQLATWVFSDSTTAVGNVVTHTFSQAGNYQVCMTVTTSNNCTADTCMLVTVSTVPNACQVQAAFVAQPAPNTNQVFQFLNQTAGLVAGDSTIWSFGDGASSTQFSPDHAYAQSGTYQVCLYVVHHSAGAVCTDLYCDTVIVTGSNSQPCDSLNLYVGHQPNPSAPNTIAFYPVCTQSVVQQVWSIVSTGSNGIDSMFIYLPNPVYTFNTPGTYQVCVQVSTVNGCTATACDSIIINPSSAQCELLAYPNPAHDQVSVNVALNGNSQIQASLYSLQNVLLQQQVFNGHAGNNPLSFNIATLPAGFYIIRLYYNGQVCFARFQKF
jgi:PKD repeat protein